MLAYFLSLSQSESVYLFIALLQYFLKKGWSIQATLQTPRKWNTAHRYWNYDGISLGICPPSWGPWYKTAVKKKIIEILGLIWNGREVISPIC